MTRLDIALAIAAVCSWCFHIGWLSGARWRRAREAARYAQIQARRLHAESLRRERSDPFEFTVTSSVEGIVIERLPGSVPPYKNPPYRYLVNPAFLKEALQQTPEGCPPP